MAGLTLESNFEKRTKSRNVIWVQSSMLSDLPLSSPGKVARPGSDSDLPATPGAPPGAKTVLKRALGDVWKRGSVVVANTHKTPAGDQTLVRGI